MHTITFLLSIIVLYSAHSKEKYAVSEIPRLLLPADVVVRHHAIRFEIKNNIRAVEYVSFAVTIFSRDQRDKGELVLFYDKFRSIDDLTGTIFDDKGNEIRELDDDLDIKDYSAVSGYSLHEDTRVKLIALYHDVYPYTVEYSYEIHYKESIDWPGWMAQIDKFPVQFSLFEVIIPKMETLRYWCNRDTVKPIVFEEDGKKSFTWRFHDLPMLDDDVSKEDMFDVSVIVRIAPREFEVEGYKGSMENWKQFGIWYEQLLHGKNNLSENIKKEVLSIIFSTSSKRGKVKKLYEFLQSKTRYVSIQLGIGGWQPFDAMYVHNRGYGDCKALTNYMQSLLSCVDIASYPVLINSGTDRLPMIAEFPSNQFNHVILCVPFEKDSIWLECTSQSMPFGRLSYSTENRSALLVSPTGGIVVRTPISRSQDNLQQRHATVNINTDGNIRAHIVTTVFGNQQLEAQYSLVDVSPEERQQWILERLKMPNISLTSFSIKGLENKSPEISISIDAMLHKYSSISTNRIFINPSILTRRTYIPPEQVIRLSPVRFTYPYLDVDSIHFTIPKNYIVETTPKEVLLQSSFGIFHCNVTLYGDSAMVYIRRTEITTTSIPPEQYNEYRTFCQNIVKADRSQVIFKRKD